MADQQYQLRVVWLPLPCLRRHAGCFVEIITRGGSWWSTLSAN